MRLLPAVAILAFLILPQTAQAQFYDQQQLAKVEAILVVVADDDAVDSCLPTPKVLKVEAELVLRRSGITVVDDMSEQPHVLIIGPLASSPPFSPSSCIGFLRLELNRLETLIDRTVGNVLLAGDGSTVWGSKAGFQEQLRTIVNTETTGLANEILKARGQ